MPSPTPKPVVVNMNVNVDASGNIDVFGYSEQMPENKIVAKAFLPVNALYAGDLDGGLIEFWEPSSDLGNIKVKLASGDYSANGGFNYTKNGVPFYELAAKKLALGFEAVLCDEFDVSAAFPFNKPQYTNPNYKKERDFGRLALSVYADALFGHVAATAAITNDTTVIGNMLDATAGLDASVASNDKINGPFTRYKSYKGTSDVNTNTTPNWVSTSSVDSANLARRLVKAIIAKGLNSDGSLNVSDVNTVTAAATGSSAKKTLAAIVAQVLGQDASRTMDQDNNEGLPEQHQLLKFIDGDKIYVQITIAAPQVSVTNGLTAAQKAYSGINSSFNSANSYTYTLEITLGPPTNTAELIDLLGADADSVLAALTASSGTTVPTAVTTAIDSASTPEDKSRLRGAVINTMFTISGQNSLTVSSDSLGLTISQPNLIVYNAATTSIIDLADVSGDTGVYINLNSVGKSITLKSGAITKQFTQISNTTYLFDGIVRKLGDTFTFGGKAIVVGSMLSVNLQQPVDPVSTSYDAVAKTFSLTYETESIARAVTGMSYRFDGNAWTNGALPGFGFTLNGSSIVIPNVQTEPLTGVFDVWFAGANVYRRYSASFVNFTPAAADNITYNSVAKTVTLSYNDPTLASVTFSMYYRINDGPYSRALELNNGFTVSGSDVIISDIAYQPNKMAISVFFSQQNNAVDNVKVFEQYSQPSDPFGVIHNVIDQSISVVYDSAIVAGSINSIQYTMFVNGEWTDFTTVERNSAILKFTQDNNMIVIPDIMDTPSEIRIMTTFYTSSNATDVTITSVMINDSVPNAAPVAADSVKYDSYNQQLVITYPTAAMAYSVNTMEYTLRYGADWNSSSVTVTRSGNTFSRVKNELRISGVSTKPDYIRVIATFDIDLATPNNSVYGVGVYYVKPVIAIGCKYNVTDNMIRLEYATEQQAMSVWGIEYDQLLANGDWVGFNAVIRSGIAYINFTRDTKYIYIPNIANKPQSMRIISYHDGYNNTPLDYNISVSGTYPPNTISEQPTSVSYDSVGQKIVLTYSSSSVVNLIEGLLFDYESASGWAGWSDFITKFNGLNYVDNTIEILNITNAALNVQANVKFMDIQDTLYTGVLSISGGSSGGGSSGGGSSGNMSWTGSVGGSMTFTFVPPASGFVFTQFYDGTTWGSVDAPFNVTANTSVTVTRGVNSNVTQVRLFDLTTGSVLDGPYTIASGSGSSGGGSSGGGSTGGSSGNTSWTGSVGGSMTFTFVPPASGFVFTQFYDGTTWNSVEAPFNVTANTSVTVTRSVNNNVTQVRLFDLPTGTVLDGPYTIA